MPRELNRQSVRLGAVHVLSGVDGTRLHHQYGTTRDGRFGHSVAALPDINTDDRGEFVVGERGVRTARAATVFSGKDKSVLIAMRGQASAEYLGNSVSRGCDINGDGHADLVVGAYGTKSNGSWTGTVHVVSGVHLGMTTKTHSLPLSSS